MSTLILEFRPLQVTQPLTEGEERDVYELREREREVKNCRKEGNGSRGRGFVREFFPKKSVFWDGKGGLQREDENIRGCQSGKIWFRKSLFWGWNRPIFQNVLK